MPARVNLQLVGKSPNALNDILKSETMKSVKKNEGNEEKVIV